MSAVVLLFYVVGIVATAPLNNVTYYNSICDTPECARTANRLLSWLDPAVDPCEDFYRYTCGKRPSSGHRLSDRDDEVLIALKEILEGPPMDQEIKCHHLLRKYYFRCMNEESINGRGVVPAVELLRQVAQWPLLNTSWSEVDWDWQRAEVGLQRWGLGGALFNVYVSVNYLDHDIYSLHIGTPSSQEDVTKMVSYMFSKLQMKPTIKDPLKVIGVLLRIAKQFGVDESTLKKYLVDASFFSILLESVVNGDEKGSDIEVNVDTNVNTTAPVKTNKTDTNDESEVDRENYEFTLARLQKTFPWANWRALLTSLVSPAVTMQDDDVIIVISPDYLERLGTFLNTVSEESLANYMMWTAAVKLAPYLSAEVSDPVGVRSGKDRWRHCVQRTSKSGLSLALASLLAKKKNNKPMVKKALRVAKEIQHQLVNDLADVPWIDDYTSKRAQKMIRRIEFHIGYPEQLLEYAKLHNHYKKFKMNTTNYFEATLDNLEWERSLSWRKIRLHAKQYYWVYDTENFFMKNAFNSIISNIIEVTGPELIFQDTFNAEIPFYIAYGDIGTTIGHELIHSLDQRGIHVNETGDSENWVKGLNLKNFNDRAQCIINQYSSFTEPLTNLNVNGYLTEGETISDNSGLKLAYHAYRRTANQLGPEPGLPNLQHYTPDQLFFITAANYHCVITDKSDRRYLETLIKTDPHPPNEFRVRGMMMNSRDFNTAFNCDVDDKMNTPNKCDVW